MEKENKKFIEVKEVPAVVFLPSNAVEVNLSVKIIENEELKTISRTMSVSEVFKAFQEAEENYIDPCATYYITQKGIDYLDECKREYDDSLD